MLTGLENGIGPSGTVPSTCTIYSWKANPECSIDQEALCAAASSRGQCLQLLGKTVKKLLPLCIALSFCFKTQSSHYKCIILIKKYILKNNSVNTGKWKFTSLLLCFICKFEELGQRKNPHSHLWTTKWKEYSKSSTVCMNKKCCL